MLQQVTSKNLTTECPSTGHTSKDVEELSSWIAEIEFVTMEEPWTEAVLARAWTNLGLVLKMTVHWTVQELMIRTFAEAKADLGVTMNAENSTTFPTSTAQTSVNGVHLETV